MKKKIANFIAFIIGVYFIIRSFFWYNRSQGDPSQNNFFAIVYFCIGIVAIIIQLVVNYRKKKKKQ